MRGWLTNLLRRILSGATVPDVPSGPELPSQKGARYRRDRKYAHECGHAVVAWLSPAVEDVLGITFEDDGSALTTMSFRTAYPELRIEQAVVLMGGLAGELLVWGRVWSGGFGDDLPKARAALEAYLRNSSIRELERRWRGRLAESGLDVAAMMARRPPPDVAAAMNICFRRAKWLLIEHRAAFDRLVALSVRKGDLSERDIASRFGPRIWAAR